VRERLTAIARAALEAVDPQRAVVRALAAHPIARPVEVLALGKAAIGMTRGALEACDVRSGLVIAPVGSDASGLPSIIEVSFGAHPIPDEQVTVRGEALLARAAQVSAGREALVLVSGGGSALAEALVPGTSIAELQAMTEKLLRAGASIAELNAARASLSRLKVGGLARALGATPSTTLVISDVPGLPASLVASGPMAGAPLIVAADNEVAIEAAITAVRALGISVERGAPLVGEASERGRALADETRRTSADALVWGGETTVTVRGSGRGGRSHELALGALAAGIGGALLAFGTDGVDGTSDAAGAFVDDDTRRAVSSSGASIADALAQNDSDAFFGGLAAQRVTGPTGTNVADLAIWLR
jgi:glycerate 2-kinase